jgi:hypothetical protein
MNRNETDADMTVIDYDAMRSPERCEPGDIQWRAAETLMVRFRTREPLP